MFNQAHYYPSLLASSRCYILLLLIFSVLCSGCAIVKIQPPLKEINVVAAEALKMSKANDERFETLSFVRIPSFGEEQDQLLIEDPKNPYVMQLDKVIAESVELSRAIVISSHNPELSAAVIESTLAQNKEFHNALLFYVGDEQYFSALEHIAQFRTVRVRFIDMYVASEEQADNPH